MPDKSETFGQRLKHLRESAGLTQVELAATAGLSMRAVQQLEAGERQPALATAAALAAALGEPVCVFTGGHED